MCKLLSAVQEAQEFPKRTHGPKDHVTEADQIQSFQMVPFWPTCRAYMSVGRIWQNIFEEKETLHVNKPSHERRELFRSSEREAILTDTKSATEVNQQP
jgi:hypothetical protein